MHDVESLADPVICDAYFAYKHLHNYKRLANFNWTIDAVMSLGVNLSVVIGN